MSFALLTELELAPFANLNVSLLPGVNVIVLEPVPSCVAFNVNEAVPFDGTLVKSISVTL